MMQELYGRWAEIQKQFNTPGNHTDGEIQDRLSEELNILEALRLLGRKTIPGEELDIEALLADRHRRLQEIIARLRKKA